MYGTEPNNSLMNAWVISTEKGDIVKETRAIYDTGDDSYAVHERVFRKNHWQLSTSPTPISTRKIVFCDSSSNITIQLTAEGKAVTGKLKVDWNDEMRIKSISFDYEGAILKVDYDSMGPRQRRYVIEKHHSEFLYFEWKLFTLVSSALFSEKGGERASSRKLIELIKEASES